MGRPPGAHRAGTILWFRLKLLVRSRVWVEPEQITGGLESKHVAARHTPRLGTAIGVRTVYVDSRLACPVLGRTLDLEIWVTKLAL